MRLSWNEVRGRAARFVGEWQDAADEIRETQSFYNGFFEIFGVQRRSVARYEERAWSAMTSKLSSVLPPLLT